MSDHPCARCKKDVSEGKKRLALGSFYHPECFLCAICQKVIGKKFLSTEPGPGRLPEPAHPECVARAAGDVCHACKDVILDEVVCIGTRKYHTTCLACSRCGGVIEENSFGTAGDEPVHVKCPANPKQPRRPDPVDTTGSPEATATNKGPATPEEAYALVIELSNDAITRTKERIQSKPSQSLTQLLTHFNRALHAACRRCQVHTSAAKQLSEEGKAAVQKSVSRKQHIVKLAWAARTAAAATKNEIASVHEQLRRKEASSHGPVGDVTLIFTDVQGSTRLWETLREPMRAALELHHALFRNLIRTHDGFEVKTEGDAFMVAFGSAAAAVRFCAEAQMELLATDWPPELYTDKDAAEEEVNDATGVAAWKGLRVRMGGELGSPICEQDPVTGRTDYYVRSPILGPAVNLAARVCGKAVGGQILLGPALAAAAAADPWVSSNVQTYDHGQAMLKGITGDVKLTAAFPKQVGPVRHAYLARAQLKPQEQIGGHEVGEKKDTSLQMNEQALVERSKELRKRYVDLQDKYAEAQATQKSMHERIEQLENTMESLSTQLETTNPLYAAFVSGSFGQVGSFGGGGGAVPMPNAGSDSFGGVKLPAL